MQQMTLKLYDLDIMNSLSDLLLFLQLKYPQLNFEEKIYFGEKILSSNAHKKITFDISIVHKKDCEFWCRKFDKFISFSLHKNFGDFEGTGTSADTEEEFKEEMNRLSIKFQKFIEDFKAGKTRSF